MKKRFSLPVLFFLALGSLCGQTSLYHTYLGEKQIGRMEIADSSSSGGTIRTVKMRGRVTVIVPIDYGVDAYLEYGEEGELVVGKTLVDGMGADVSLRFKKEDDQWIVEKKTGNRDWVLQKERSFRASTLFFYHPPMIEKFLEEYPGGGIVYLMDIENSRVTELEFEFAPVHAEPWGNVISMHNKGMINYFDPESFQLLYSEVRIMGRKITTVLQ